MTRLLPVLAVVLFNFILLSGPAFADEVKLPFRNLTLNANLEPAGEWPAERVVLITHGMLAHNRMEIVSTLQTLFKERGVATLAVNLSLGLDDRHGAYDCATPHRHRYADALDEIDAWFEWLRGEGVNKVMLLGHSLGGSQSALFAAQRDKPALFAIALVAPGAWDEARASRAYRERYAKALTPIRDRARELVEGGKGDILLEHTDFLYCADTRVTAKTFLSYYKPGASRDTPSLLGQITKPVVVFVGTEDTVLPGLEERIAPLADGDRIRLEVMDGADHFFRDLYAEDLADVVVEFMNER